MIAAVVMLDGDNVPPNLVIMDIRPTPDQDAFIRAAIAAGRIARPEDAASQAMALWEERERRRAEILAHVDEAEESIARGEGLAITPESTRALAEDVKRHGRASMAAENAPRR